jgi:hypothetical protein
MREPASDLVEQTGIDALSNQAGRGCAATTSKSANCGAGDFGRRQRGYQSRVTRSR